MSMSLAEVSHATKDELQKMYVSGRAHLARIREQSEAAMEKAIAGGEVVGASFGVKYLMAKGTLPTQIGGYDTPLALGVAGMGAGFIRLAGKHSDHLFFAGAGCMAAWAADEGDAKGRAA